MLDVVSVREVEKVIPMQRIPAHIVEGQVCFHAPFVVGQV